jgi:hydroxymethylpyrimidine pyrophosphatase-like HAD family hydrolase
LFEGLKQDDIRFVAASGRQFPSMRSKLQTIAHQMSFISENGALIVEQEQVLHQELRHMIEIKRCTTRET